MASVVVMISVFNLYIKLDEVRRDWVNIDVTLNEIET